METICFVLGFVVLTVFVHATEKLIYKIIVHEKSHDCICNRDLGGGDEGN